MRDNVFILAKTDLFDFGTLAELHSWILNMGGIVGLFILAFDKKSQVSVASLLSSFSHFSEL